MKIKKYVKNKKTLNGFFENNVLKLGPCFQSTQFTVRPTILLFLFDQCLRLVREKGVMAGTWDRPNYFFFYL